ncbi:50S ribosomal protein L5 [Candidatus Woesearchaeota archaeon]|nr:50S ribosomal protein L5 [Candidatus Woesearchaeota archaeon]
MNKMKEIQVEKITLNVGVGETGDRLEKASKLLKMITGAKPVKTRTMKRVPTWGIRPKLEIATKVTLRGEKAESVLRGLLKAKDNAIPITKFDNFGNFSFGIHEYIEIPGVEYDSGIGIIGLEVAVTLKRPGFRINRRRINRLRVPEKHRISREESIEFVKNKFGIKIEEKGE